MKSGKLWLARDLCIGLIGKYFYNEELFRLGGEIWYKMDDLPRAGLYWMLTTEESPEAEHAINAAIETYGEKLHEHIRIYHEITVKHLPEPVKEGVEVSLKRAGSKSLHELFHP